MGIYDREYYRTGGPSFLGHISQRGLVCKWLIGINVVVFLLQVITRQSGIIDYWFWLKSDLVLSGQVWRLLTHAFLHDVNSIFHILFNMLFLWWLGHHLEEMYGSREFLAFYLTAAVFSGMCYVLTSINSPVPALGASGAVTAVIVLYAFHFPKRTIYLWFIIPVQIWLLVVLYVGMDLLVFVGQRDTGVAVAGHLGGALFGFMYFKFQWRLTRFTSIFADFRKRRSRPKLKVYREEVHEERAPVTVGAEKSNKVDEQLEAKVDAVLEKMSRVGRENLTDEERDILLRASEVYKKRNT